MTRVGGWRRSQGGMAPSMAELTDLERAALAELVNRGVGRAAPHLGRTLSDPVLLSAVPPLDAVRRDDAARFLTTREPSGLIAVEQEFRGAFAGRAVLILPEASSLELARAVLDRGLTLAEIIDLEQDALAEIGNIVLNGCLVVLANALKDRLTISLPAVLRGSAATILRDRAGTQAELALFLGIDLSIRGRGIHGYLALLVEVPALDALKRLLHDAIDEREQRHGSAPV